MVLNRYSALYNNVTSVCIFIGCWPWSQMASNPRQQTCFSFFMPPKSFNKPFEFLLYKTNRLHFSVCVYCNRSQKTSQRVKNNNHATRLRLVSYFFQFFDNQKWKIHVVIFVIWLCMYGGTAVYSRVPFISLGMVAILLLMVLNLP